jgi:membrane dipeptidase
MPRFRGIIRALLVLTLAAASLLGVERSPAEAEKVAQRVLARAIIVDTHEDTPDVMFERGYDLADSSSPMMVTIPKMREGHLGAAFFAIYVSASRPGGDFIHGALDLIDLVYEQVGKHSDAVGLALTADEVVRLHRQNRIAILMGAEGGHMIENDLRLLDILYRLGGRYLTLTHMVSLDWADSSSDKPRANGLSDFGRQVVARLNQLGMMVDVSHVSDKTFADTLAVTKAPVIASHSSCRALADNPRNLSDDMLRQLAQNGGVIQINFYSPYLDQAYAEARRKTSEQRRAEIRAARQQFAPDRQRLAQEIDKIDARYEAQLPVPSFTRIADHIDHAVQVGGVDHVGLGSDFDGIDSKPRGMEDVSKLPNLVRELARRGYSETDLEKILGGNLLRVMRQVEEVSHRTP